MKKKMSFMEDKNLGEVFLELDGPVLSTTTCDNMHVKSVHVFAGDDDSNITDYIELSSEDHKIHQVKHPLVCEKYYAPTRMRNELGVTIVLEDEWGGPDVAITLSHHKGSIFLSSWHRDDKPMSIESLRKDLRKVGCKGCGTRNPAHFVAHECTEFCGSCSEINDEEKQYLETQENTDAGVDIDFLTED